VTTYLFGSGFPAASSLRVAVIRGSEKASSSASSKCSPLIVISTWAPAFPPIGIVVRSRGAGRHTDCASEAEARLHATIAASDVRK
jgi:hypothetical protein